MKIKFMLEYAESPLWAIGDEAQAKYGYNIDLKDLNLHPNTIIRIKTMTQLYWEKLNPIYQGFPSFWSGRMNVSYQTLVNLVFNEIENQIGQYHEIINEEISFLTESINVDKIDLQLKDFISDPSYYSDKKGITYKCKIDLKEKIRVAFEEWQIEELKWTTI